MIKIKNKSFQDNDFRNACIKLEQYPKFPVRTAYQVMKILRLLNQEQGDFSKGLTTLLKKYALLDEKGEFISSNDPEGKPVPGTFTIPEANHEAYKKERIEFSEMDIDVDWKQLKVADLEQVNMTPAELSAIEGLIDFEETSSDEEAKIRAMIDKLGAKKGE